MAALFCLTFYSFHFSNIKNSIPIISFFVAGAITSYLGKIPSIANSNLGEYVLYLLLFLVGIGIGADKSSWHTLRNANVKILLVPLTIVVGSLSGAGIASFFLKEVNLREALAVGAGFGYYSLSSFIITDLHSEALSIVALMANIFRETVTLVTALTLRKYFGKLAPIAAGGATAMDTTLPIISQASGKNYVIIAIFSGMVLSILVPFIVTFILR